MQASTIWSPVASDTNIQKLQITQNNVLRIITGCTMDINIEHLHQETKTLPISCHLKLHASQQEHQAQHPSHSLYDLTLKTECLRKKKKTMFCDWNGKTINVRNDNLIPLTPEIISKNLHTRHTSIAEQMSSIVQAQSNPHVLGTRNKQI